MKRAVLFILGVITLLAMTSCAGGASGGGSGAEESGSLRLSIGTGSGRAAGERNALFANGALTVNLSGDNGFSKSGSTTLDTSGSGTLTIKSIPVGITVLAEASITANGITYTGSTTTTTVEGTTPVTITVRPDTAIKIPADVTDGYMDALLAKLTAGQIYTLTIGNLTSFTPDTLMKKLAEKTECSFRIVLNNESSATSFTSGSEDMPSGISNITSVDLSQNTAITSINDNAFINCTGLTEIIFPPNLASIGESAFENCTSLSAVSIPSGVTRLEYGVFLDCSSLSSVTLPSTLTGIDENVFQGCTSLINIDIPSSVSAIGECAFEYCTQLQSVTIPSGVTIIKENLFSGCTALTNVTIPSGVTTIKAYAFENCTSLDSITMPASVTQIGSHAFSGNNPPFCLFYERNVGNITFGSSVAEVGVRIYYGSSYETERIYNGSGWGTQ